MKSVTVISIVVGAPRSKLPVRLASQTYPHLMGNVKKSVKPVQLNRTQRADKPEDALINATVSTRRIHPTTSLATPAESATTPTVVSSIFNSVKIRQSTGKAVIPTATATKS